MEFKEIYMDRCLQLAHNGVLTTAPNPMVGAVIVWQDQIIGEGYHIRCGEGHAEVNAIASVKRPELLRESTMYVSLEPCAHYGKTPPCADLIVEKQIPRVVIGCRDPFAKVAGRGIQKLLDAGIEVVVGVKEKECLELNKHFLTFHQYKRPFITLKWAESADRYMDAPRKDDQQQAYVFSTPETTTLVHKRRAEHQAILIGGGTAIKDNPSLNVRHWGGKSPLRLVVDTHGALPENLKLLGDSLAPTRIYTFNPQMDEQTDSSLVSVKVLSRGENLLAQILEDLHQNNILSLLVEGGAETLKQFLEQDLWDEIYIERSPVCLKEGTKAPEIPMQKLKEIKKYHGHDLLCFQQNLGSTRELF